MKEYPMHNNDSQCAQIIKGDLVHFGSEQSQIVFCIRGEKFHCNLEHSLFFV